jgi:type II secretory pathway pseudopilin PulG
MINRKKTKAGFTLVEILIVAGLLVLFLIALSTFGRDVFIFNNRYSLSFSADSNAKSALKKLTAELRAAESSATGGFLIEMVASTSRIFFSDPDGDGVRERLRYFIEDRSLKRGIIEPSGNPVAYVTEDEKVQTLIADLLTASSSFIYFGNDYDGSNSSTPLTEPIDVQAIRMARFIFVIQAPSNRAPAPYTVQSEVMIRNLKDNW